MSNFDAVQNRLNAVAGVDWTVTKSDDCEEYYTAWVHIGPVLMEDLDEILVDAAYEWSPKSEQQAAAVIDFLTHAAADIRVLLDALDNRGTTTTL